MDINLLCETRVYSECIIHSQGYKYEGGKEAEGSRATRLCFVAVFLIYTRQPRSLNMQFVSETMLFASAACIGRARVLPP